MLTTKRGVPTLYMIMMTPQAWLSCAHADRVSAPPTASRSAPVLLRKHPSLRCAGALCCARHLVDYAHITCLQGEPAMFEQSTVRSNRSVARLRSATPSWWR